MSITLFMNVAAYSKRVKTMNISEKAQYVDSTGDPRGRRTMKCQNSSVNSDAFYSNKPKFPQLMVYTNEKGPVVHRDP